MEVGLQLQAELDESLNLEMEGDEMDVDEN
jgi:hypothetical protein